MKTLIVIELAFVTNGEWHFNPIDFTSFLEEKNILQMLKSPRLNENDNSCISTNFQFYVFNTNKQYLD
jgi:hypothetical protein